MLRWISLLLPRMSYTIVPRSNSLYGEERWKSWRRSSNGLRSRMFLTRNYFFILCRRWISDICDDLIQTWRRDREIVSSRNVNTFLPFDILIPRGSSAFRSSVTFSRRDHYTVEIVAFQSGISTRDVPFSRVILAQFTILGGLITSNLAYICPTILIIPTNSFCVLLSPEQLVYSLRAAC